MYKKICEVCGKPYTSKRRHSKVCTPKCRKRKHRNIKRNRVCPICDKSFELNKRYKYCSETCLIIAKLNYDRQLMREMRKDPIYKSKRLGSKGTSEHYRMSKNKDGTCNEKAETAFIIWQKKQLGLN